MKKVKLAMVGSSGFAGVYFERLKHIDPAAFELVGVVDPFVQQAKIYPTLQEKGIATFDTIEELYASKTVEAICIVSPPVFHKHQVEYAMNQGSKVLCEKPLTPLVQDTCDLADFQKEHQDQIGVGFQWSYAKAMLDLKKDILAGVLGKPKLLKVLISWPRGKDYYSSSWHGHLVGKDGTYVLDSVLSNATAHYLFNILYLLGSEIALAAEPEWIKTGLYRAKEIESYDTCTIRGGFKNGAEFLYLSTHSAAKAIEPTICYEFENATVRFVEDDLDKDLVAIFKDGTVKHYGKISSAGQEKVETFLNFARDGGVLPCDAQTVVPQQKTVNFIFEKFPIQSFAPELILQDEKLGNTVSGINEVFQACFEQGKTPAELAAPWAKESTEYIGDYKKFSGIFGA